MTIKRVSVAAGLLMTVVSTGAMVRGWADGRYALAADVRESAQKTQRDIVTVKVLILEQALSDMELQVAALEDRKRTNSLTLAEGRRLVELRSRILTVRAHLERLQGRLNGGW